MQRVSRKEFSVNRKTFVQSNVFVSQAMTIHPAGMDVNR